MPNILRRPMFKLGGSSSDGVGITSGFRKGYNWGGSEILEKIQANPNMSSGEYVGMATSMLPEILKSMQGAGKMDNYELAMMISDVAGKGGSISDMVTNATTSITPFVDRYKKAQASMGPAAFNMLGTMGKLKAASETAGKETVQQTLERNAMKALELYKKHGFSEEKMKTDSPEDYATYKTAKLLSERNPTTRQEAAIQAWKILEGIIRAEGEAFDQIRAMDQAGQEEFMESIITTIMSGSFKGMPGLASGGRVGKNIGGSMQTDMVAENIQTPGGDVEVAAEETMETPTPGQDPYIMLRARLPREITDDVVRLIAYNPEAFKDFAAIETQEDVIDFNATYGVELVLPAQQV